MKRRIKIIPSCTIETEQARKALPAWTTERVVFYVYGIDWVYLVKSPDEWWLKYYAERN